MLESSIEAAADILRDLGAREVYVFGSAARGALRADSDIDLAVVGLPPAVFFRAASRAADILGRPADLVDLDDESPAVDYLRRSGELVRVKSAGRADRDLIEQMAQPNAFRQAVISVDLAPGLKEYLAFRHLFRGASIALMRWNKMQPLADRADEALRQFDGELDAFLQNAPPS